MLWAALFRSKNKLDGYHQHLVFSKGKPVLFATRQEAVDFINDQYDYLRPKSKYFRKDLRREPHGWLLPQPVKVSLMYVSMENK